MSDVDQLLTAHRSVTQLTRSLAAAKRAPPGIGQAMATLAPLVNQPGRGRPAEVGALNRAAIVLISAHLEGFVEDLYSIAASNLLTNKISDISVLVSRPKWRFSNPKSKAISQLFRSIGIPDVLSGIGWQRASNLSVHTRLNDFVDLRNKIAHGPQPRVTKAKVQQARRFVELFAENLDEKVSSDIASITHQRPW